MQLVKCRNQYDSGVACLAMLLGVDYKEARERLGRPPHQDWTHIGVPGDGRVPVMSQEISYLLTRSNMPHYHLVDPRLYEPATPWVTKLLTEFVGVLSFPSLRFAQQRIDGGDTAAALVPSRMSSAHDHWVVLHQRRVYDPVPEGHVAYTWDDTTPVKEMLLLVDQSLRS